MQGCESWHLRLLSGTVCGFRSNSVYSSHGWLFCACHKSSLFMVVLLVESSASTDLKGGVANKRA
jgi:hypothetical protein